MNSELDREALALPEPYAYIEIDAVKGTIICVDKQSPTTVEVWTRSQIETALSTEAQLEVTGAVAYVDDKCGLTPTMHGLFAMKPGDQLYQGSAIKAAVRENLEAAALIAEAYREVTDGQSMYIADKIRALMERPHTSVEEPAN